MGYRLYVAKTFDVRYSFDVEAFNYAVEEFHTLLSALDIPYTGDEYDGEFEIDKEIWLKGIGKLRNLTSLSEDEQENINDAINGLGYSLEEVINLFEGYFRESDSNNDYMHFCFL